MHAETDIPSRLAEEIALRAYDDKYIDRNEEREILQIAIQLGVRLDTARAELAKVCARDGFALESSVVRTLVDMVNRVPSVDEAVFGLLFTQARRLIPASRGDWDVKSLLVQVVEDHARGRVRVGWLRNWFRNLKRDLGSA